VDERAVSQQRSFGKDPFQIISTRVYGCTVVSNQGNDKTNNSYEFTNQVLDSCSIKERRLDGTFAGLYGVQYPLITTDIHPRYRHTSGSHILMAIYIPGTRRRRSIILTQKTIQPSINESLSS
jgi:hypothetical protein